MYVYEVISEKHNKVLGYEYLADEDLREFVTTNFIGVGVRFFAYIPEDGVL